MISKFITLMDLDSIPDQASVNILNGLGQLISTSETNSITSVPTATGAEITVDYDVPELDPGKYTVVFDVSGREYNVSLDLGTETVETNGFITLNQQIDTDVAAETGSWNLYRGNTSIDSGNITGGHLTKSVTMPPSLDSGLLVVQDNQGAIQDIEIFSINATILKAIRETRSMVDRLQRQLRIDALEYDDIDYLRAMVRARDRFNMIGLPTAMTMTNAQGPIRGAWLTLTAIEVIRARSLEEGLTAYDYGGASVTLSVDVRSALEEYLMGMEQRVMDEIVKLKSDLHRRGNTSGDGSYSMGSAVAGAVGVTLGPASGPGYLYNNNRVYPNYRRR